MAKIVLGVTGSVAAYRAGDLAREMMRRGHTVRACLTRSGAKFVSPSLFEALTGQPCLVDAFDEPEAGRMAHIDWARWADVLVVAPATAHSLAVLAQGEARDMISTIALATHAPLVVAPAMNPAMYAHPATQASLVALRSRAAWVVEPESGMVACGDQGQGKLASINDIASAVQSVLQTTSLWKDKHILITSGPTQEPWDSARYLTNRSSGKMGAALARAGLLMGAQVTVVAGPQEAPLPLTAQVIRVKTALQMRDEVVRIAPEADLILGAAAVADFRPAEPVPGKIRRNGEEVTLRLIPNPDVIAEAAAASPSSLTVAFAAEPNDELETAVAKIARKGAAAIAVNNISRSDIGFGADSNELTLVWRDGTNFPSGVRSKLSCAIWLLEKLAERTP